MLTIGSFCIMLFKLFVHFTIYKTKYTIYMSICLFIGCNVLWLILHIMHIETIHIAYRSAQVEDVYCVYLAYLIMIVSGWRKMVKIPRASSLIGMVSKLTSTTSSGFCLFQPEAGLWDVWRRRCQTKIGSPSATRSGLSTWWIAIQIISEWDGKLGSTWRRMGLGSIFFAYSAYFIAHYMQNMQNNLQAWISICRILQDVYSAYLTYIRNPGTLDMSNHFCIFKYIQVYDGIYFIYLYIQVYTSICQKHAVYTCIHINLLSEHFPYRGTVSWCFSINWYKRKAVHDILNSLEWKNPV